MIVASHTVHILWGSQIQAAVLGHTSSAWDYRSSRVDIDGVIVMFVWVSVHWNGRAEAVSVQFHTSSYSLPLMEGRIMIYPHCASNQCPLLNPNSCSLPNPYSYSLTCTLQCACSHTNILTFPSITANTSYPLTKAASHSFSMVDLYPSYKHTTNFEHYIEMMNAHPETSSFSLTTTYAGECA